MANIFDEIFSGEGGLADTLLDVLGNVATVYVKKTLGATVDIIKGTRTETTVSTNVITSPLLKYSAYETKTYGIQQGDSKVIGKGIDFTDVQDNVDSITIAGTTYMIVSHRDINSGANKALVMLQVRKQV